MLALACAFAVPSTAWAQDARARAKAHFDKGSELFKAGKYEQAIREFETADALVPSPILTYNIALAKEKLGKDDEALALYEKYLKQRPDAPNRASVEKRIAAIRANKAPLYEELPDEGPAPTPVPSPSPPGDTVEPQPQPPAGGGAAGAAPPRAQPRTPGPVPIDDPLARRIPSRGPAEQAPSGPSGDAGGDESPVAGTSASAAGPGPGPGPDEPPPPIIPEPAPETPVYKEWWFWAVIGVSAIVLVSVAASGTVAPGAASDAPMGQPAAALFTF